MKTTYSILILIGLMVLVSCQRQSSSLTDEERKLIMDSTTQIFQELIDESTKNFKIDSSTTTLYKRYFSADPDVRHVAHGVLFSSFDELMAAILSEGNVNLRKTVELFEEKADRYDVVVLSRDAVSITAPCHWKMKVTGLPEYNGKEVLSAIFQKRNGKWMIIQSHISDPNICEAMAALMPPKPEK